MFRPLLLGCVRPSGRRHEIEPWQCSRFQETRVAESRLVRAPRTRSSRSLVFCGFGGSNQNSAKKQTVRCLVVFLGRWPSRPFFSRSGFHLYPGQTGGFMNCAAPGPGHAILAGCGCVAFFWPAAGLSAPLRTSKRGLNDSPKTGARSGWIWA